MGLKTLFDQRRALLAWAASLALLIAMYVAIWPSMRGQPSMSDFLNQMPEAMRSLFATTGPDMSTPGGYLQVELLSFMGPLVLMLYTVTAGAGAIAGEEDRHTMDLLLASPVSRTRVMLHMSLLALVFGALALAVGGLTGHGTLTREIPAVVAVVAYVANGLAPIVSWLEPLQKLSPFYQYVGHDPLRHGVSWPSVAVAVATIAVLTLVAVVGFRRRDVVA